MTYPTIPYNLSIAVNENTSSFLDFVRGVNDGILGSNFMNMFMIGIGLVVFFSVLTTTNDVSKGLITSGVLMFVLSITFVGLGLVSPLMLFISFIIMVCGIAFSFART